jgi:hypothetical protein
MWPGHTARDRVAAEAHVDALLAQVLGDLVDSVLRLRRHAVAGLDDHVLHLAQQLDYFFLASLNLIS